MIFKLYVPMAKNYFEMATMSCECETVKDEDAYEYGKKFCSCQEGI